VVGQRAATASARTRTVNHDAGAFTQNKRYRQDRVRPDRVVNQNGGLVYQTDAFSISTAGAQPTSTDALKSSDA